jgi:hypothetical protein
MNSAGTGQLLPHPRDVHVAVLRDLGHPQETHVEASAVVEVKLLMHFQESAVVRRGAEVVA